MALCHRVILALVLVSMLVPGAMGQEQAADPLTQAITLFDSSRFDEAKAVLDVYLKDHPQEARAVSYRGRIALIQDDIDKSVDWCEKAVKLEDGNAEYHLWLARAYGLKTQKSGKLKQAFMAPKVKREFERAVELDPQLLPARMGLMEYYIAAPGIMGGSKEKASLQAAEVKKQNSLQGHIAYVMVYEANKENDKARQEYLDAIREYPDSLWIRFQLGYFYQRNEDFDAAFALFEEIHLQHPEALNAIYQIGRTGALSGQKPERAEECLQLYLQSSPGPNDPSIDAAHFRLGQVYEKSGRKELAIQEYEAALSLNPKHKQAQAALKKLK